MSAENFVNVNAWSEECDGCAEARDDRDRPVRGAREEDWTKAVAQLVRPMKEWVQASVQMA
jgi:hypothetical protein